MPRLAQLRPLAVRYAKARRARSLSGSLRARGTIAGDPRSPGVTIEAHGEALEWGRIARAATLDVAGSIAPGRDASGPLALSARPITATVQRDRGFGAAGRARRASGHRDGHARAAQGHACGDGRGRRFHGSARPAGSSSASAPAGRRDRVERDRRHARQPRDVRGHAAKRPPTLVVARDHFEVGATRVAVAEGRVDLVKLAGRRGPHHDARLVHGRSGGGRGAARRRHACRSRRRWWSAATGRSPPRRASTARCRLRRERGDWFATESATLDPADLALGISVLELSARFTDDALAATAQFRSARGGNADASATLAAGREPGRIDVDAPFTASVTADLASLRPLQPWLGTLAVMDGRARIDIKGRGTLANPILDGTLTRRRAALRSSAIRRASQGRQRCAHVSSSARIVLDELSFAGGAGRFTAKGTLARARARRARRPGRVAGGEFHHREPPGPAARRRRQGHARARRPEARARRQHQHRRRAASSTSPRASAGCPTTS